MKRVTRYLDCNLHFRELMTINNKANNNLMKINISRKFYQFLSLSSSDSRSPTALDLNKENQLTFSFLFLRFNWSPLDLWVIVQSSGLMRHWSLGTANYKLTPLIPKALTSIERLLNVTLMSSLGWSFRFAKSGKRTLQNFPLSKNEYFEIVLNFNRGWSVIFFAIGSAGSCYTTSVLSLSTA